MVESITIPVFVNIHALRIVDHLKNLEYLPVFYYDWDGEIPETKEVIVFLSLFEFVTFIKEKAETMTSIMFLITTTKKELAMFSEHTLMFDVYRKKTMQTFVPSNVLLTHIVGANISYTEKLSMSKLIKASKIIRKS